MKPTTFTARLGAILLYVEREMEGSADYETILREVEKRLEILRTDAMQSPASLKPVQRFATVPRFTAEDAASWAANYYGFTIKQLRGNSREARISMVRHVVMWFLRCQLCVSLSHIGQIMNRNHSTVHYGSERIAAERARNAELRDDIDALLAAYQIAKGAA